MRFPVTTQWLTVKWKTMLFISLPAVRYDLEPPRAHRGWRKLCDVHIWRGEDKWILWNTARDRFLPPVVTFRYRGVNRAAERRMTLLSAFFIPLNTAVVGLWSVAFSAIAEHESDSLHFYQSSVLALHCVQGGLGISFAAKVGTSEVQRQMLLCVSFLGN